LINYGGVEWIRGGGNSSSMMWLVLAHVEIGNYFVMILEKGNYLVITLINLCRRRPDKKHILLP